MEAIALIRKEPPFAAAERSDLVRLDLNACQHAGP
jgi:hypothetical protein